MILTLDFETRNKLDISVGTDRYCRTCTPLMLGWAIDNEPVQVLLLPAALPERLLAALRNPAVQKIAAYAAWERLVLLHQFSIDVPIEQWRDVMILARHFSIPGSLDDICDAMHMGEDEAKIKDGKHLIDLFSTYNEKMAGTKTIFGTNDGFGNPLELKDEYLKFIEYCRRDVEVERSLWYRLLPFSFPEEQWRDYHMSEHMNETGLPANSSRAKKALGLAERYKEESQKKLREMTGLANANSRKQLLSWLSERGYPWGSINKKFVETELKNPESKLTLEARDVLTLRRKSAQNSYTKLETLLTQISLDGRLRYQYAFMGAPRTGRWSAGGVQVTNMPRPEKWFKKMSPEHIYDLIDREAYDEIKAECEGSTLPFVSSFIRMAFEAPPNHDLVVGDLASIEYNVAGWVARCPAILECIRLKHDPYLDFAPHLFPDKHYTYEWLKEQYDLKNAEVEFVRQMAKPPVLGGGFGLGGGEEYINEYGDKARGGVWGYALNVCGTDMPKEMAHAAVAAYRKINPEVVKCWEDCNAAFQWVIENPSDKITIGKMTWDSKHRDWVPVSFNITGACVEFSCVCDEKLGKIVRIKLPSGRYLHYINCCIEEEEFEYRDKKTGEKRTAIGKVIYYEGIEHSATEAEDGSTAKKKFVWGRTKTYGGKVFENVIQAIARDILVNACHLAVGLGFQISGVFHDEIMTIVKREMFGLSLEDLLWCLRQPPKWGPTLMLDAAGWTGSFYHKE